MIIPRARWGARHARGFGPAPLPAQEVWLHHSVTIAPDVVLVDADRDGVDDDEERAMRTLEDIGDLRFGGGISYTFAVMPSGRVYEGHGVDRQGAHTKGRNDIARAIVLVGNYEEQAVTEAQVRSVAELLCHGQRAGWWKRSALTGGHQQAPGASTLCPGRHAMAVLPLINKLADSIVKGEDEMPSAKEIAKEVAKTFLDTELDMMWPVGATETHKASVRAVLAWTDRRQQALAAQIAGLAGMVAAQGEVLARLGAGLQVDPGAVTSAAETAVRRVMLTPLPAEVEGGVPEWVTPPNTPV